MAARKWMRRLHDALMLALVAACLGSVAMTPSARAGTWYFSLQFTQTLITDCPGGQGLANCYYPNGQSSYTQVLDGTVSGSVTIDSLNHLSDFALHAPLVLPQVVYNAYPNWGVPEHVIDSTVVNFDVTPANGTASLYAGPGVVGTQISFALPEMYRCCDEVAPYRLNVAFTIGADLNTETGTFAFAPVTAWNEMAETSMTNSYCGVPAGWCVPGGPLTGYMNVYRDFTGGTVTDSAPAGTQNTPEPGTALILSAALAGFAMAVRKLRRDGQALPPASG